MKITIITVVWNNKKTIRDAIDSVLAQTYRDIEYIIIDGASTDGTIEIIKSYGDRISNFVSEPDNGIYDAMNKGIKLSSGDVIGLLNSDDLYINENVIEKISMMFKSQRVDSIFADLVYVKRNDKEKIVRYFDSSKFKLSMFAYGFMPAHPTFFVKKSIYEKYGLFRTDLKIASDFDLFVRFLFVHKISYYYNKEVIVKMRYGGVSTSFRSLWSNNTEILKACRSNGIETNIIKIFLRYFSKLLELVTR